MTLVFPIWRDALERPLCILVWREPVAVARSLQNRDGLPLVIGLALWEEYARAMLAYTIGLPRVLISYEDLVRDPVGCGKALAQATGLDALDEDELREIVDPSLNHCRGEDDGFVNRQQVTLRDALHDRSALTWSSVPATHEETRNIVSSYWAEARESARLRKKSRDLGLLLDAVFSSRSWRIGFAITRLWRKLRPTNEETAVDRWKRMR